MRVLEISAGLAAKISSTLLGAFHAARQDIASVRRLHWAACLNYASH